MADQWVPAPDARPLDVYPNPSSNGPVTVGWPQDFNAHALRVVDSLGRKVDVLSEPSEHGWRLTLQGPASGTLHLLAVDRAGRVARGTWVVGE